MSLGYNQVEARADFEQARAATAHVPLLYVFSNVIALLDCIPREREGETKGIEDCYPVSTVKENELTRCPCSNHSYAYCPCSLSVIIGHLRRPFAFRSLYPTLFIF